MASYDLCTVAQAKTDLELTDTRYDALIGSLVSTASLAINRRCQREFAGQTNSVARDVRATGRWVDLAPWDLRSATSIVLDPAGDNTTLTTSDYQLVAAPNAAGTSIAVELSRYVALPNALDKFGAYIVRVTGNWGAWTTATVPDDVRRACIVTVGAWMDRAVAEYGVDTGDGRSVGIASAGTWAIPGAAWTLLQSHTRATVA